MKFPWPTKAPEQNRPPTEDTPRRDPPAAPDAPAFIDLAKPGGWAQLVDFAMAFGGRGWLIAEPPVKNGWAAARSWATDRSGVALAIGVRATKAGWAQAIPIISKASAAVSQAIPAKPQPAPVALEAPDGDSPLAELSIPAAAGITTFPALLKNPAWPMDLTASYRTPDGETVPPMAVWVKGLKTTVIMMRMDDPAADADLLPVAAGFIQMSKPKAWQPIPEGWRFITPDWVFRDLNAAPKSNITDADGLAVSVGVGSELTMADFIRLTAEGQDNIDPSDLSPYEFGSDLAMEEYRAEQAQIQADDKDRPKGISPWVNGGLIAALLGIIMFGSQV